MNKKRRKEIAEVVEILRAAAERLNSLAEEEREAFENLLEGIQAGEWGQVMEEAAEALESAASSVEEASEGIESL